MLAKAEEAHTGLSLASYNEKLWAKIQKATYHAEIYT